ncbi:hypothetical protein HanRHA438_Chr13g0620761 [Helianthus annuus]|nr:hypothetical protein HanRHA438_Chr13g0620761 [Helianthus annuus]
MVIFNSTVFIINNGTLCRFRKKKKKKKGNKKKVLDFISFAKAIIQRYQIKFQIFFFVATSNILNLLFSNLKKLHR